MIFMLHKLLVNYRMEVEEGRRFARPSASQTQKNVVKVRELLNTDH